RFRALRRELWCRGGARREPEGIARGAQAGVQAPRRTHADRGSGCPDALTLGIHPHAEGPWRVKASFDVAVVGGGPAGLMASEVLACAGATVTVYDRMPSVGRKFLLAGRGGLNLTHSEDFERFLGRYGPAAERLRHCIETFRPAALRAWCEGLGQPTFVGSSGR